MFDQISEPREVIVETMTATKCPTQFGPFTQGLKCRRKMKVLLNYTRHQPTIAKYGVGYFKDAAWIVNLPNCPLAVHKDDTEQEQKYVRFLLLETIEEEYLYNGVRIPLEMALKHGLPRRGKPDPSRPLYMTLKVENVTLLS